MMVVVVVAVVGAGKVIVANWMRASEGRGCGGMRRRVETEG